MPFAVATHLGLFVAAPTVLAKLLFRRVDVRDSESHVVHDAEGVMVSVGGNVEHVFDPVGAIGDLHVDPAGFVVFPPTMPVDVEAENISIEAVFRVRVPNDEADMDDTQIGPGPRSAGVRRPPKADAMPLRVYYCEVFVAGISHFQDWDLLRRQVFLHRLHIVRGQHHLIK